MKRNDATHRELLILASVKAEMQKPRFTESVREGEREEAARKGRIDAYGLSASSSVLETSGSNLASKMAW